jgi:mRNA interferase RelE/StbE
MKYEIERMFAKDVEMIKDDKLSQCILDIIDNVANASTISDINNIKKLKGYKTAYRIRSGDYRIGVTIVKNVVTFVAFDHRKDIYKHFP